MTSTRTCCAIACCLALSCADADPGAEFQPALEPSAHADLALAVARQQDKLANDVEHALSERWSSVGQIVRGHAYPLGSVADVLSERGLPDAEAGLPEGVFSTRETRRRYFAAVLLAWGTEPAALKVAARVEADRMTSLNAARAELPDVDQRILLDQLGRASSDRLHALCQRSIALGSSCTEGLLDGAYRTTAWAIPQRR